MTKQIHLADFIAERRRELRLARDEVATRAKRAGYELSGSYVAKIENRESEPATISMAKLDALAAGLGVSADLLFRIARGIEPAGESLPTTGPMLEAIEGFKKRYEPTEEEWAIIRELEEHGIWYSEFTQPNFWNAPPDEREGSFLHIKGLLREHKRRMQGK